MSKWTNWMKLPLGERVVYGNEIVKMKEGDDGEIYYKRLRANVEAESAWKWSQDQIREATAAKAPPLQPNMIPPLAETTEQRGTRGRYGITDCNFGTAEPEKPSPENLSAEGAKAEPGETTMVPTKAKPIITGLGEYVTADGQRVTIYRKLSSTSWVGNFPHRTDGFNWRDTGEYLTSNFRNHDITGPWVEPKPEPEMWIKVYTYPDGRVGCSTPFATKAEAIEADCPAGFTVAGTFKLIKEPDQ